MFDNGSTGVGLCSGERQTDPNQTLSAAELDSLYTAEYEELVYRLACEAETTHPADDEPHLLPNDLETIPPGIFLGAVLATVEVAKLTGFDLVRYVQAAERQVSHANADLYEGIGELGYADEADTNHRSPVVVEFVSEELQTALARTRRSADYELGLALDLRHRVPQVWEALGEGRIDLARARVFVDQLATLNPELIPAVLDQILDHAPELTTGQLRARLKKLIIAADPTTAQQDLEEGLEERRMVIYPNPDHTASLGLHSVDPLQAVAASEHIHKLAMRQNQLSGEIRTLDQICADIALDLLQGKSTNADVDGVTTA